MKDKNPLPAICDTVVKPGLLFFFSILAVSSLSQTKNPDSSLYSTMYKQYMNGVGGAANLYSGAEYEGTYAGMLGSPFLNEAGFQQGSVCYEGVIYANVLLAYDLVRAEVLIKGFQQLSQRLEKTKVAYFMLAGHSYVHLIDTVSKAPPPDDFYDLLYNGAVRAFAKRVKVITKGFHAENEDTIRSRTAYFLYKDGAYYSINDGKDLLKIFSSEKDALKAFWKERALNFKKEPEAFITQTLRYWTGLKK